MGRRRHLGQPQLANRKLAIKERRARRPHGPPAVFRCLLIAGLAILPVVSASTAAEPAPTIPASASSAPASLSGWLWPLAPHPAVVRGFEPPAKQWLSGHRGVDLLATPGDRILAPAAGQVAFVGWVVDRPVLTILNTNGTRSSFEPVTSPLTVGAHVARGQVLGILAQNQHCALSSCLHWGVRRAGVYVDPLQFIMDRRPSILLPLVPP